MSYRMIVGAGPVTMEAELNDTPTARRIWEALPIAGQANMWGEEIYFAIPVKMEEAADARADVEVGELGYWPLGEAFCIFFGPTPASTDDQPRAASPVNVVGRLLGDPTAFRKVTAGATVMLERAEQA
ncbi:MAG: cyclophilin-like fold protein [Chloroflexota bacterium]